MIFSKHKPEDFGISKKHFLAIIETFKEYPQIQRVILFGSRAKGCHKAGSDVDLAIDGDDITASLIIRIQSDFEESTLPYLFDLLDMKSITSQELLQHIKDYGVTIYGD